MALTDKERDDFANSIKDRSVAELQDIFNRHMAKAQSLDLPDALRENEAEKAAIAVGFAFSHKR